MSATRRQQALTIERLNAEITDLREDARTLRGARAALLARHADQAEQLAAALRRVDEMISPEDVTTWWLIKRLAAHVVDAIARWTACREARQ